MAEYSGSVAIGGARDTRWGHAIRDDADLERRVDSMHYDPVRHGFVSSGPDWPHRTFHRYASQGIYCLGIGPAILKTCPATSENERVATALRAP